MAKKTSDYNIIKRHILNCIADMERVEVSLQKVGSMLVPDYPDFLDEVGGVLELTGSLKTLIDEMYDTFQTL